MSGPWCFIQVWRRDLEAWSSIGVSGGTVGYCRWRAARWAREAGGAAYRVVEDVDGKPGREVGRFTGER